MSRELNGEINADNTFKEWTVTNLLSSPAVAETHPKIHVKLAPHLRKVRSSGSAMGQSGNRCVHKSKPKRRRPRQQTLKTNTSWVNPSQKTAPKQ